VPEEFLEIQAINHPIVRIENLALRNVCDEDRATSSTSHLTKSTSSCNYSFLSEGNIDEEYGSKFTDNIDLKTDILDALPSDAYDEEDISSSIPSSELCDDGPSTSKFSVKFSGRACFKFFRHEKSSIYYIQSIKGKDTKPYVIFNSVPEHGDKKLISTKLFVAKKNFEELSRRVGIKDWMNVRLEVNINTRHVILHFDQSISVFADWPDYQWELETLLNSSQNFVFFSKCNPVDLHPSIKFFYTNSKMSFCKSYQRNRAVHSCYDGKTLGLEWINHIISPAEMVHRNHNFIESKVITSTRLIQIEQKARQITAPNLINCLPLTLENAIFRDKLFAIYEKTIYSNIQYSAENYDEDEETEIFSNANDQSTSNEIIQIDEDVAEGTNALESMEDIEVQDMNRSIFSNEPTTRLDHVCPYNLFQELQMCPKRFLICSFNDVVALSEHVNQHLAANRQGFKSLKIFKKQISTLDTLTDKFDESLCPIDYCRRKIAGRIRHHDLRHKIEALCFLLVDYQNNDQCLKLLANIRTVLPNNIENVVKKYRSRIQIRESMDINKSKVIIPEERCPKIHELDQESNSKQASRFETRCHQSQELNQEPHQAEIRTDVTKGIPGERDKNNIEKVSDAATTLLKENAFQCVTCFNNESVKFCGLHDIKNHINLSEISSHSIKCIPCNEIYTIEKGSRKFFLHVHGFSRNHVLNVMKKKKLNRNPQILDLTIIKPITHYCEVCQSQYKDHYSHISSQIHSFNVKLLLAFLDYCLLRHLFNLGGEKNFGITKEEIVFFFKTLHCFSPATLQTRKKLCGIMKEYVGYVFDGTSKFSKFRDWVDDPVVEAMLRQSSLPSTTKGVCFSCNQIFTTSKSIEKHSISEMHLKCISVHNFTETFRCLKCEQFMTLGQYLEKRHIQNCIDKKRKTIVLKESAHYGKSKSEVKNRNHKTEEESSDSVLLMNEDYNNHEVQEIIKSKNQILVTNPECHKAHNTKNIAFDGCKDKVVSKESFRNFNDILSESNSLKSEVKQRQKSEDSESLNCKNFSASSKEDERLDSTISNYISISETEVYNNFDYVLSLSSKESRKRKQDEEIKLFEEEKEGRMLEHKAHSNMKNNDVEYFYFCLDCEKHTAKKNCSHLKHSRVPIGMDITKHLGETGHENFEPIRNFVLPIKQNKMLRVKNVSYSQKWGDRVRKCYKKLILSAVIEDDRYEAPRNCLRCSVEINNATDMFLHLKTHL